MHSIPMANRWEYDLDPPHGHVVRHDKEGDEAGRLSWAPIVQRCFTLTDSNGEVIATRVQISVKGQTAITELSEVQDGSVWMRFQHAAGSAQTIVRQILSDVVHDQIDRLKAIPFVPAWSTDGTLALPPVDVLPPGYRRRLSSEATGRRVWAQIAEYAKVNPKLALTLGAGLGGLLVSPLRLQSCWLHLTGQSSAGKTTALRVAASLFGDADDVCVSWNGTLAGTTALLGELGCLTSFRDELDAGHLSREQLRTLVFRSTEGNKRAVSRRDGTIRRSRPWHGILVSTGNVTIRSRLADNEGVAGRVIELETPIVRDAQTAETLDDLCAEAAGWPLEWLTSSLAAMGEPDRLQTLRDTLRAAQTDLGELAGGVMRRTNQQLAVCVAGAAILDELLGTDGIRLAALHAAAAAAEDLARELAEAGASPLERLCAAIEEEMGADPASWPTRQAMSARVIELAINGLDISRDDDIGADVAVYPNRLRQIAARHDISDIMPAIREGVRTGAILTQRDNGCKGNRAQIRIQIDGNRHRMYAVRLSRAPVNISAGVDQVDHSPQNRSSDTDFGWSTPPETGGPGGPLWSTPAEPETAATATEQTQTGTPDGDGGPPPQDGPPAIPGAGWTSGLTDPQPCMLCLGPTTVRDPDGKPRHMLDGCQASNSGRTAAAMELSSWRKSVAETMPEAGAATVAAALERWHEVTGGITWQATPPAVGLQWWHAVNRRHGKIPDLGKTPPVTLEGPVRRYTDRLMPVDVADPVIGEHFIMSFDVNAQYLAATGAVVLGTGAPERHDAASLPSDLYKRPGYVRYLTSEEWVPMPLAKLWARDRDSIAEALTWDDGRRWLAPWGRAVRDARALLMAAHDEASVIALAMLKRVYSGFLGGMLRSLKHNRSAALRPDWSDQLVGLSTANQERAQDKTRPNPIGHMRDTAWWLVRDPVRPPLGLTVSQQPGKWKPAGICIVTDSIVAAWASGKRADFRDAVNLSSTDAL